MSKAKDEFYKWFDESCFEGTNEILNYVKELEQRCGEYHDLVDTRTIKINELEQQKAELISTLGMALSTPHRKLYLVQMKETLKKYTGE